jgi:prepilin-type N-terminal cleavage/methylation domain-containing protein
MKTRPKGFALTELIVVIALIGIMLAIVSLNFSTWQKKSNIEDQAKEMMADLNGQRLQAMQTKTSRMAVFNANPLYVAYRSYTGAEQLNPTPTTGTETFRKYLKYPVYSDPALTVPWPPNFLLFDATGILNSQSFPNPPYFIFIVSTGTGAALDCLAITTTRMNLGQSNGTTCVYQ